MGSAPYLGGGFGHFYAYAPIKIEYAIDRFAMETKRQLDVLDRRLAESEYLGGDDYTIADIAIWPWYGGLAKGLLYGAGEFLSVHEYKNVQRWADEIGARPAVKRGRMVNRLQGDPAEQLHERHDASDFDTEDAGQDRAPRASRSVVRRDVADRRHRGGIDLASSGTGSEAAQEHRVSSTNRPKVAFIGTGGTMSSLGVHPLELQDYGVHENRMHASEIVARFPVVEEIAEVIPVDFRNVPSPEIYFAEWKELAALCHRVVAEHPDLAGIVIGHGTATLEETAWVLNLVLKVDVPVVLIGSQRPASGLSTDAAINLRERRAHGRQTRRAAAAACWCC